MANEKNLIPNSERTPRERRENAKKAGKASGKKRREQKTYREMAKAMLSTTVSDPGLLAEMKAFGLTDTDLKAYTLLGLIKASGQGSYNAFDRLMELLGEQVEASTSEEEKQTKLLKAIERAVTNSGN